MFTVALIRSSMSIVVHHIIEVHVSRDRNQRINSSGSGVDTMDDAAHELSFQSILHSACELFLTERFRCEEFADILREVVQGVPDLRGRKEQIEVVILPLLTRSSSVS